MAGARAESVKSGPSSWLRACFPSHLSEGDPAGPRRSNAEDFSKESPRIDIELADDLMSPEFT